MSTRLVNIDRETPMLMPPDLRDWVGEGHPVQFVLEAVALLPQQVFHDTICTFRRQNTAAVSEMFVRILGMAREMGVLKARGGVRVDGTKSQAHASKHAPVS